jgi:CDP-6-deoxy-D-xylo-4-hexulose-3-dehydrase
MKKQKFIRVPYGQSIHGIEEIKAVNSVLKSSTQMGKSVFNFESKIAKLFQKKYGLMVNSGSSALLLAFEALSLPKGSEVITPTLTFATTVSYILKYGLKPVFVDVDQRTYCANLDQIKNKISKKTSAIIAPHLLGNIVDWETISKFCRFKKIKLIEDSADTLGAKIRGKSIGKHTHISITSFYGSHIINGAGNGGMVCFNDKKIYQKAKLLRSWGRSSSLFDEKSEKIENRFNIKLEGIPYDKKFVII